MSSVCRKLSATKATKKFCQSIWSINFYCCRWWLFSGINILTWFKNSIGWLFICPYFAAETNLSPWNEFMKNYILSYYLLASFSVITISALIQTTKLFIGQRSNSSLGLFLISTTLTINETNWMENGARVNFITFTIIAIIFVAECSGDERASCHSFQA